MKDELTYQLSQTAYIKLVLHALKHKTTAVNGVLIGRTVSGGGGDIEVVEISDAVPLFHSHQIGLLPSLEIALLHIEEHSGAQGLSLVGYFHANERFNDAELSGATKNVGDQIYRYFPHAAVLLLDNKKLEALPKGKDSSPVMQLYTRDASRNWKLADGLTTKEPTANIVLLDYISSKKWEDIVDFDDHLDDLSKDWSNAELFK